MNKKPIPSFIINLKKRKDRRENIIKEFKGRSEFAINVVEPLKHNVAAVSLWITIKHIVQNIISKSDEMIIICEDDHQFTTHYSKELLFKCIVQAKKHKCDVLSGGVSCVKSTFQVNSDLYWMEDFTGLQFTVIFRSVFQAIIDFEFSPANAADIVISSISDNKLLIYPYISTQKEFGYSDVTYKNNIQGRVDELFNKSAERVQALKDVFAFYKNLKVDEVEDSTYENIYFPTYILHDPENPAQLQNIKEQFKNKEEFEINIIEASNYHTCTNSYAEELKKIIETAIDNDDDIIIICEDTHQFTENYSKAYFIKNIIEAHQQGANLLMGSVSDFDSAVLLSENRFWLSSFLSSKFIVVFNKMFHAILAEPFNDPVTTDNILSGITSHKIVLFPFISITNTVSELAVNSSNFPIQSPFDILQRFNRIKTAYKKLKFVGELYS